jgi:hypothetical protein
MKRLIVGLLMVFLLLGTVACAAAEPAPEPAPAPAPAPEPIPAPAPAPPKESSGLSIFSGRDDVVVETPPPVISIPEPAPAPAPAPEPEPEPGYAQAWSGDRMIIRSGYMTMVVVDVASAMEQITNLAATYDGYVVASNSWQDRDRMMGSISIRVDAEFFNDAIRALRAMAVEVRSESTSGQDVTEEYVDLSAKLRNLEAAEAQLLELMKRAGEVKEILEVQRELVDTREDIERTKGRMQYLEESAAMSYIEVSLEQSKLTAEFNATSRTVKEGERIRFIPEVAGGFAPYSFEWDFGDGNTSTEEAPRYSYKAEGTYTVTLKVTDDEGTVVPYERADYITVLPGWSAGSIASSAWNGLIGFFRVLADIIIWLGIFSPVWIIILVILYFTWWRKRKKKES